MVYEREIMRSQADYIVENIILKKSGGGQSSNYVGTEFFNDALEKGVIFQTTVDGYPTTNSRGSDKQYVLNESYLFSKGLRFRKNDKRYPGSPDIVLPKYKTIVFVHGCFWHLHEGCKYAVIPKSNVEFWEKKLYGNRERDERNQKELKEMGWRVITVWECELKKDKVEQTLEKLYVQITSEQ